MLVNKEINIKKYYRFIEFCSKLLKIDLKHERFKSICLDNYKAETRTELEVKFFSEAYMFLINNINQILTKEIIQKGYYLLTNLQIDEEICKEILSTFYGNFEKPSHHLAALIHFKVLEKNRKRNIEFAFMLSNYVMLKKNRSMIIPYINMHKTYFKTIKEKNLNKLILLFSKMEDIEVPCEEIKIITKDEVIEKVKKEISILINRFNLTELYLYGSFSKDFTSNNSDIDFLTVFDSNLLDLEKNDRLSDLKVFLKEKLGRSIDLIDFPHALENMDICEMEKTIKII